MYFSRFFKPNFRNFKIIIITYCTCIHVHVDLHYFVSFFFAFLYSFSLPPSLLPSLSSSLPLLLIDQFPLISDDLVNSHYLLLCCIDMLCAAAIIGKRQELLSPDFTPPSLPAVTPDCDSAHSLPMDDYPTIIPELCRQFSGNYVCTCTCIMCLYVLFTCKHRNACIHVMCTCACNL